MSKYQKEIESLLSKSESGINKKLQQLYKDLAEEITQDIIKLAEEIEKDDEFSKKLQKERLEAIRSQMYAKANELAGNQEENIYDFLRHDGQIAFNELFYDFEMTEKIPLSFAMMTDKRIATIINTPVAGRKLSTRLKGNSSKMKQNLNRVLTRGFAKGWSTQKMAAQIAEIGGANYRRAMNIARTESGRVTSVARQQSQNHAKEIGLKTNKRWISTLDGDTRTNHRKLDGKTVGIDEYFEVDGHKALQPHMFGVASEDCNCRCRTIAIIEGYEPDVRRDNETKDVIEYQNYGEWLNSKGLSPNTDTKMSEDDIIKVKFNQSVKDGMTDTQSETLENILNKAPESVRRLWNRLQNDLVTVSSASSKSFYRKGNGVYFNYKEDSQHPEGKDSYATFFHEYGHHIDSLFGKTGTRKTRYKSPVTKKWVTQTIDDWKYKSNELDLSLSLQVEYNGLKKKYGVGKMDDLIVSMKKYAKENYPRGYNGVSDIISGITMDKYNLGWHHSKKYWQDLKDADGLGKEAFANMFQAYAMQNDAHDFMMETFPESYQIVIDFIEKEGGQDV